MCRAARGIRIIRVLRGVRATRVLSQLILQRRSEITMLAARLAALSLNGLSGIAIARRERASSNIRKAGDADSGGIRLALLPRPYELSWMETEKVSLVTFFSHFYPVRAFDQAVISS